MQVQRRKLINGKLLFKLRLFSLLFTALIIICIYEISHQSIGQWMGSIGIFLGFLIGYIRGRTAKILLDETAEQVVMKMDWLCAMVLITYLIFSIFRKAIVGHWMYAAILSAFIIFLSAGAMLGRYLTTKRQIKKILKEKYKM